MRRNPWLPALLRVVVVLASLSVTAIAIAAVHRRQTVHQERIERSRAEGRAFVDRLRASADTTRAQLDSMASPEPALVEKLVTVLRSQGRLFDDVATVGAARAKATELALANPTSAHAALLLGETELSLHRVAEARAAIATARRLGGAERDARRLELEVAWLAGDAQMAIDGIRAAAEAKDAPYADVVRLGTLELELGRYDVADAAFRRAEALGDSEDILGAAMLELYRGLLAEARGRSDDAERRFRASLDLLPAFVPAADHLAELEAKEGRIDVARALYERLVIASPNPEFLGALASVEQRMGGAGAADRAREHREKARERFEELLARFPEAMAWHAAEFFSSAGDSPRAVLLLEKNLEVRPNGTSRYALARAELEVGDVTAAKAMMAGALSDPPRSAPMLWTAARIDAATRDAAGACAHRASALAIDPHVGEYEPALGVRCP